MLKQVAATPSVPKTRPVDVDGAVREHAYTLFNHSDPRAVADAALALVKLLPGQGEPVTPALQQALLSIATAGDGMIVRTPLVGSRDGQGQLAVREAVDPAAFEAALRQLIETPVGDLPGRRLIKDDSPPSGLLEVYVDNKKQYIDATQFGAVGAVSFWVEPRPTRTADASDPAAAFTGQAGSPTRSDAVVGNSGAKIDIAKGQGVLGHLLSDKLPGQSGAARLPADKSPVDKQR